MKKIIKIKSCTGPYDWYKNNIGEVYNFKFMDDPPEQKEDPPEQKEDTLEEVDIYLKPYPSDYVVDKGLSSGELGSIYALDVEVSEVDDDVNIRDIVSVPTELDFLRCELELTQNAINEILMSTLGGMQNGTLFGITNNEKEIGLHRSCYEISKI